MKFNIDLHVHSLYSGDNDSDPEETIRHAVMLGLHGIGPYSGFGVDPMRSICDPQKLSTRQLEMLGEIEDAVDDETLMASRYVLAALRKP